jgi:eukaryotic-like serine/threonine-protein kinase
LRLLATILLASAALCPATESAAGGWEGSKQNKGWVLSTDRRFNGPMLYYSNWREAPVVATERQFNIGAIFSSPLVVNGVVYFGSTDGNLYALD